MYCDQRSQYIRLNSKKNSFRGNYTRKYGICIVKSCETKVSFFAKKKWALQLITKLDMSFCYLYIQKISFGRTLGAKLPQSHMWYWVYNCVYNWLNLEKITFFFLQLQSCDRHSITFRNHLKYIQVNSLEKVPYVQYCIFKNDRLFYRAVRTEFRKSKQKGPSKNY